MGLDLEKGTVSNLQSFGLKDHRSTEKLHSFYVGSVLFLMIHHNVSFADFFKQLQPFETCGLKFQNYLQS